MAVRKAQNRPDEAPSQDSFLDVVANLVGILIILVMVVGVRTKNAWVESTAAPPPPDLTELQDAVKVSKEATSALEADINEIARRAEVQQAAVAARRAERNQLQLMITAAERAVAQRREQLEAGDRAAVDLRRDLRSAQEQLERLNQQRRLAENATAPTIVIRHIPTPMAKTVFGKEVHFRLLGGRLAYVPLNELVEKMRDEIRFKAEKLKQAAQTIETVGPIGGFHLRYILRRVERVEQTRLGEIRAAVPQFVGFYLIPTSDRLGEPLDEALQPGSQFLRLIEGLNPDTTTITVWVYPDSFREFLVVKNRLLAGGFLTASWPLPKGQPISGSPSGHRSAAQ